MRPIEAIRARPDIAEVTAPLGCGVRGNAMTPLQVAQPLLKANISVIPVKTDGSKSPAVLWKPYQAERMTAEEAERLFSGNVGIGIIGGAVSGNLEIVDIEGRANGDQVLVLIEEAAPGLLVTIPLVRTPSGGLHLYYRCPAIEGNQKLAMEANDDGRPEVLIETRGEGGYVLAPGSPPECHPSGKTYDLIRGRIAQTPVITLEQRAVLLDCCRSFNSYAPPERYEHARSADPSPTESKPGADYASRADVTDLLQQHGWAIERHVGDTVQLRRPGKKLGISAVWNHGGHRHLYVFSSNAAPFEPERGYNAFSVYGLLEHAGDFTAAARQLAKDGYGDKNPPKRRVRNILTDGDNLATRNDAARSRDESGPTSTNDSLPLIQIMGGHLMSNIKDAEAALAAATLREPDQGIYQRSGRLVAVTQLSHDTEKGGVRREAGMMEIHPITSAGLKGYATDAADWQVFLKTANDWVPKDCPDAVARALIDLPPKWMNIPNLRGVVESPVMRADGSVFQSPGYDQETQLYYDPGSTRFPTVLEDPTRRDAEAALTVLQDVIRGFPFNTEADRSVALAALLTPFVRAGLRAAPMFAFSAPKPGSGKTLLSNIPAYIATGRAAAVFSQTTDPEEEKKRFLALLTQGSIVNCLDNVEVAIKSDALCTILTEPYWQQRVLGSNRTALVSTRVMWVATGNNIVMRGDLSARSLLCYLDPAMEHPEEREFDVDLHETVPKGRAVLVVAALTIMLAYQQSGERLRVTPYGRFEDWSRRVREPLIWLGCADPCETRKQIEATDPVADRLANLFCAWALAIGMEAVTVAELIRRASESSEMDPDHAEMRDLKEAMTEIAEARGSISSRSLGKFISSHANRIEGGLHIARHRHVGRKSVSWRLQVGGRLDIDLAGELVKKFGVQPEAKGVIMIDRGQDSDLVVAALRSLGRIDVDVVE